MWKKIKEYLTYLVPPHEDRDYMTRRMEIEMARLRLRDEFAMAALTGLLASSGTIGTKEGYCSGAYAYADAMLEARGTDK